MLAPPETPPARVAALRRAFHAAMTDPEFVAEAERQKIEIGELDGEQLAQIVREAFALPADVVRAASDAMNLSGSTPVRSP